jgi:hypothetical protein
MLPGFSIGIFASTCCRSKSGRSTFSVPTIPEILIMPAKAFHRKLRYEISGAVQQKVWVADGFKCMYCGAPMGKAQLTIDHFTPLELGGENNQSNYLSACRRCNKDKGSEEPKVFCDRRGISFSDLVYHLAYRKIT